MKELLLMHIILKHTFKIVSIKYDSTPPAAEFFAINKKDPVCAESL